MGRLKTVGTGRVVTSDGILRLLSDEEGLQQKVEVLLLNGDVNRNNWKYENLDEHKKLFAETPLLVAYKGSQIGDGHNFDEVLNPDGTVTASFMSATAERIVGWFKAESDIRLETIDNKTWIVGTGYIWKWYAQELVAKLRGQGRGRSEMSVSIETLIDEMHKDGDTEVYTKYQILGTTILGDEVEPAVKDASIRALSAIGKANIRDITLRVASANPQPKCSQGENDEGTGKKKPDPTNTKGFIPMNSKRIKELNAKFPDFRVLSATENGVALYSADGDLYYAPYTVEDSEIFPGVKVAVNAVVVFGEGDNAINVTLEDIRNNDMVKIADLTKELEAAKASATEAENKLATMKIRENDRRVNAIKAAIKSRFDAVRQNAECELAEDAVNCLLTDAKVAEYAVMEDADGKFCGDIAACKDVDAICMDSVLAAGKKRRENARHNYVFNQVIAPDAKDGLDAMIANTLK